MRLTGRFAFWSCLIIWGLILLPFFIPALNTLTPKVLGLPFVVFWQYFLITLHFILCVVCAVCVWDPFDANQKGGDA
jgi:hypothetical protein